MKPYVLIGAGQFADYVQYILEETLGEHVAAFAVDREFLQSNGEKNGRKLISTEDVLCSYPPDQFCIAIAFLGKDLYQSREAAMKKFRDLGYEIPNIIHPSVRNFSSSMGIGNIVGAGTVFEPFSVLGSGNVFFANSLLSHNCTVGSFNLFASNITPTGNSSVGSHCFIGAGSVINNYVHVADFTLVGARAFVAADTRPREVVVPARSTTLAGKDSLSFGK